RVPTIAPEGAAPHHAENIVRSLQLFPAIIGFIGVHKGRFVPRSPPQAPCPLQHVPAHLFHAIRAYPVWKASHGIRRVNASLPIVSTVWLQLMSPGITSTICTASGFLPFCLTRQGDAPALLTQEMRQDCRCCGPFPQP